MTARVSWQDMSVRSLSQAVDAYGKAAQMLGVPEQALWHVGSGRPALPMFGEW
jgi:hypothetical protein